MALLVLTYTLIHVMILSIKGVIYVKDRHLLIVAVLFLLILLAILVKSGVI